MGAEARTKRKQEKETLVYNSFHVRVKVPVIALRDKGEYRISVFEIRKKKYNKTVNVRGVRVCSCWKKKRT